MTEGRRPKPDLDDLFPVERELEDYELIQADPKMGNDGKHIPDAARDMRQNAMYFPDLYDEVES